MQAQDVPSEEQIDRVVNYLTSSVGLAEADVPKMASDFPQIFGCDVEQQLQQAVGTLEKEWKMKGPVLKSVLKRRPQSLGCNVDCGGSCWGKCDRCAPPGHTLPLQMCSGLSDQSAS
jgi:mTERF